MDVLTYRGVIPAKNTYRYYIHEAFLPPLALNFEVSIPHSCNFNPTSNPTDYKQNKRGPTLK